MAQRFNTGFQGVTCLLLGLLMSATIGCSAGPPGKPSGDATITITFGGEPVAEGMVSLQNKAGEGAGAQLNPKGVASLSDVVLGDYVVTVTPPVVGVAAPDPGKAKLTIKDYANIPANVRRTETTPLKVTIKKGANEFKFDLKQ